MDRDLFERRTFFVALLAVTAAFLWLMKPFFGVLFWATAIALVFAPVQQRLARWWPSREGLVASLTLLLCLVLLVLPALFIAGSLASEGLHLYARIQAGEFDPASALEKIRQAFPLFESLLQRLDVDFTQLRGKVGEAAMASSKLVAQQAFAFGQNTFELGLNLILTLYVAFFFLRDGRRLVDLLIRALPLGDSRERLLLDKFAGVTRATIKGSLLVALAQGVLGGMIFAVLGIQGALLWGAVMVLVSLIPAVGAALIWAPVAIYLFATGDWVSGLILVAFGVGIIGMVDNLLRPILVGRDTQMPDYLVLLSTLGGLGLFGMNGLIIGPLVAALFLAFWEIFIREFGSD
jgi:predicted PurR-regulated permease PerM